MRFVLALLLALAFAPVHAAGITTTAKFFEPTVEQSSQDWEAIKVQHKAYLEAKEAGDWVKARELALFHFTRAWAYNNEAFELVLPGWNDPDKLAAAVALYEKALEECDLAQAKGRYLDEVKDCRLKSRRTLASVKKRLAELGK